MILDALLLCKTCRQGPGVSTVTPAQFFLLYNLRLATAGT